MEKEEIKKIGHVWHTVVSLKDESLIINNYCYNDIGHSKWKGNNWNPETNDLKFTALYDRGRSKDPDPTLVKDSDPHYAFYKTAEKEGGSAKAYRIIENIEKSEGLKRVKSLKKMCRKNCPIENSKKLLKRIGLSTISKDLLQDEVFVIRG